MIRVVCSACRRPLRAQPGDAPPGKVSHGLCRPCVERLYPGPEFAEIRALAQEPVVEEPEP